MKPQDQYLMFVRWSEEDRLYVGYCPDLTRYHACYNMTAKQPPGA